MALATENTLEGLLRPIYEWYECGVQATLAGGAYFAAAQLGVSPLASQSLLVGSVAWIAMRYVDGYRVRKYQKGLNTIEPYFETTQSMPHTPTMTWIGKGFEWTEVHAQRVYDSENPNYKKFYKPSKRYLKTRTREKDVKIALAKEKIHKNSFKARHVRYTSKFKHNPWDMLELITPRFLQNDLQRIFQYCEGKIKAKEAYGPLVSSYRTISKIKWKNPLAPPPPVGGNSVYHGVGVAKEVDQHIDLDERNGHAVVFGQSRVGKSRFLELLLSQDIQRNDGPVILTDPKGDSELLARAWSEAKRLGRDDNFYIFSLGFPDISAKYNAVAAFSRMTAVASRISGSLSSGGDSAVFADFAWRFLLIVANAMFGIGEKPTFKALKRYIEDLEPIYLKYTEKFMNENIPDWREQVKSIRNPPDRRLADGSYSPQRFIIPTHFKGRSPELAARDKVLGEFSISHPDLINVTIEGLRSALKNEMNYYNKITASLIPLLTKLTSGEIADLLSPDYSDVLDAKPEISWQKIIEKNSVVVILLDAMTDPEVANAVGAMMFSDLLSVAGDIYKHGNDKGLHHAKRTKIKPIWLHIDEFHSVLKGGHDGEPFQSILNRAAGSGVRLIAYTQTLQDIENATGSPSSAGVILGNFNSVFMMRVQTIETAEYFTKKMKSSQRYAIDVSGRVGAKGESVIDEEDLQSGDGKAEWFTTATTAGVKADQYLPIITPDMIMQQPKGQAFAFINGNRVVKLRFPLLKEVEGSVPPDMDTMMTMMKKKYQREDIGELEFA